MKDKDMVKKVEFHGQEFTIDRNAQLFAFKPEGETEVYVFAGWRSIGTVSEIKEYIETVERCSSAAPEAMTA